MTFHKMEADKIRESLEWRQTAGNLALQTAFLKVVRATMDQSERYKQKQTDNVDVVIAVSEAILKENKTKLPKLTAIQRQQAVIIACIGPDFMFLPRMACCQPADFYIDDRCGNPKMGRKRVYAEVQKLLELATAAKLNVHNLPEYPSFHNCGIW